MNDADTLEVGDEDLTVTVVALEDELAVVAVGGEIDIKTAGTLWHPLDTLVDNGRRHLVLDLGAVTFMDSSGLSVLIRLRKHAGAGGGWVRLAGVGPRVAKLLQIAGLTAVFPCYDTVAAARTA